MDTWIAKQPAAALQKYRQEYRQRQYAKRIAHRPRWQPCPVCQSTRVRWRKGRWSCAKCNRDRNKKASYTAASRRKRERGILHYTERVVQLLGQPFADVYTCLLRDKPNTQVRVPFTRLLRMVLTIDGHPISALNAERIICLNKVAKQLLSRLGWACARCSVADTDFRFFDIDHITPRSRKGHSRLDNLQILCPNCHRRKTLRDLYPASAPS